MPFDPAKYPNAVRISGLIAASMHMEVHCNKCARFGLLDPAALPFSPETPVPALAGRFKCARCDSTDTEARPHYPQKLAGYSTTGWSSVPT